MSTATTTLGLNVSSSLVSNTYLDENANKMRSKLVPWEGYQRAGLATAEEIALIKKVDRQPRAKVDSLLLSDGQTYILLYLRLLKKLQRVDTMQCLLILMGDALLDHVERIPLFTQAAESDSDLPFGPLLRALETQDEFVQLKASQILTVLLSSEKIPLPTSTLRSYINFLATFIQGSSTNKREVSVQCLESLLTRPQCRRIVWENPNVTAGLIQILRQKPSPQLTYQIIFCIWLLTFEPDVADQINSQFDVIPIMLDIAQAAAKEKVVRVVVSTFRNLVLKAPEKNLPAMLVAQLLPFVKNLATRKWTDEDILDDVQFLRDELTNNFQSLSTYDEYSSELSSGHLSWSPPHESEDFWKDNATKLNDSDFAQLKVLVKLLQDSTEPLVLAVAAHDIGQYVKHYERGKKVVTELGAKTRLMDLMMFDNSDVRYRALLSVQQLVSQPWVNA
ncbi:armadillo-type protein [Pterulicium gracile]|uniref:V-type proton ATPase subunit H n=1 Tax=Pterulicium gracile TaxID=1884261 RepID=A0A5C3R3K7_9AGAR|nr:armadillo-type protein [Pterula gracilis]